MLDPPEGRVDAMSAYEITMLIINLAMLIVGIISIRGKHR